MSDFWFAIETRRIVNPGIKVVMALAQFYGVPIGQLVGEGEINTPAAFDQSLERIRHAPLGRDVVIAVARLLPPSAPSKS